MICPRTVFLSMFLCAAMQGLQARAANSIRSFPQNNSICSDAPHGNHPKVLLSNGQLDVLIFLPDPQNGYYRSSRFDWSGVVACAAYKNNKYFGEWFQKYDPLINDSITGPVEEFKMDDSNSGYAAAAPGGTFVKVGVGVLRKLDDRPYNFGVTYPIVDGGKWTVQVKKRSIVFTHRLKTTLGVSYTYQKTLSLDKTRPILTLSHRLKNEGAKPIVSDVYDHDFFMLNGRNTGPGIVITFPFNITHLDEITGTAGAVRGNQMIYLHPILNRDAFSAALHGYSESAGGYDFITQDHNSGAGIEQSADRPISRFFLWSISTTVCPEAFIHLHVPPGKTTQWQIHYRFLSDAKH